MTLLFLYLAVALGISFVCSILEAVLLTISPSFIAQTEQSSPKLGRRLQVLKRDVDRPLAAILSLNTIAHTVGAAGVGAQAAMVFGDAYVGLVSGILTILILIFSEIIPKTLGTLYWRQLTPLVVRVLGPVVWLMWPLVKMAQGLKSILARGQKSVFVRREEFIALAEMGAREGVIGSDESRILTNLFKFNRIRAVDIMTPRTVIFALPQKMTVSETIAADLNFSRIPVYNDGLDDITGFVLKEDILRYSAGHKDETTLAELKRPLLFAPGTVNMHDLLDRMIREDAQMAIVVDEYGGTAGLVTIEDILETLLGLEIVDEGDPIRDMRELARRQWKMRAIRMGLLKDATEDEK